MKHYLYLLLFAVVPFHFVSCGDDNEETNDNSKLISAYEKVKTGIIGNWIEEARYTENSTNPYIHNGWNENNYEKFTFTANEVTNRNGETSKYTLTLDETSKVYFNSSKNANYWPFVQGKIVLSFNLGYQETKLVELRDDGKLYIYGGTKTTEGIPYYRMKRQ